MSVAVPAEELVDVQFPAGDINAGVEADLKGYERWTLYLSGTAGDEIKIELSPDGGTTYYELDGGESPVTLDGNGVLTIEMGYDGNSIRLTNETGTDATAAQIRGTL